MSGLLIVNADDFGGMPEATDGILRCFAAGAITSATAMVHMADSARAADLAGDLPLGLHLNLTEPFNARDVPAGVRERQRVLCAHFGDLRRRRWSYHPRLRTVVADAIRDQQEAFAATYPQAPTHLDGHQHVHVCPDVLLSAALPRGTKARQTRSALPGASIKLRAAAAVKHRIVATRFRTPSDFLYLKDVLPEQGGAGLQRMLDLARRCPVEVMCHPSFPEDLAALLTDDWCAAIAAAPLGSFTALE